MIDMLDALLADTRPGSGRHEVLSAMKQLRDEEARVHDSASRGHAAVGELAQVKAVAFAAQRSVVAVAGRPGLDDADQDLLRALLAHFTRVEVTAGMAIACLDRAEDAEGTDDEVAADTREASRWIAALGSRIRQTTARVKEMTDFLVDE